MALDPVRDSTRYAVNIGRKNNRHNLLVNKRKLGITHKEIVTQEQVVRVVNKMKKKSDVHLNDLALLKSAFSAESQKRNIEVFMKITGSLQSLVRELSSHKYMFQLVAAECLINLALGDPWVCVKVARVAGPYLITLLSGCNYNIIGVCLWALGNLAGSDEETWQILYAQGFIGELIKLLGECDQAVSDFQAENMLLALVQVLHTGYNLLKPEEIKLVTKRLENLSNPKITSSKGYRVSEFIISCTEAADEELLTSNAATKCLHYMEQTAEINAETVSPFTAALRTVANTAGEPTGVGCCQVLEHWTLLQAIVEKVFSSGYNHLGFELAWLVSNLMNHPNCQSSVSAFVVEFENIKARVEKLKPVPVL